MNKQDFSERLKKQLEEIQVTITQEKIEKFYIFMQLILEWNEKINLTAIIQPEEIITKHFIDSLTISKLIPYNTKVIDVGSGAGFPGIPLKILRDDIEILLLDSLNKRVNFLNIVIQELKLEKIQAIHSRAEDAAQNVIYREKFDISTSRAVANMSTLSEYLLPFVKVGGNAVIMKGNNIEEELEKSKYAISILGGKIEQIESFNLPQSTIERKVVLINKKNPTQKKYPRGQGRPSKNPL